MKIIYNGVMAKGTVVFSGWKQSVQRGETYEVPDDIAKQLLKSEQWKKVEVIKEKKTKKKEKKEKKEEIYYD